MGPNKGPKRPQKNVTLTFSQFWYPNDAESAKKSTTGLDFFLTLLSFESIQYQVLKEGENWKN